MTIAKVKSARESAIDEVGRRVRLHDESLVTSLTNASVSYEASNKSTQFVPTAGGHAVPVTIGRRRTDRRDVRKLLVSHATAQARGLHAWMESGPCGADCYRLANT
eukprot:5884403-Pyramimonas_sp.AAC.1